MSSGVGLLAVVSGGATPQYCPWGVALFITWPAKSNLIDRYD